VNPVNHVGCSHGGWREVSPVAVGVPLINAAREAATYAARDLRLDLIAIHFFEAGPIFLWQPDDRSVDRALVTLNAGAFDASLLGKACHPEVTPLPTVWVRSGLSPALTAAIVLHEARHVWQFVASKYLSGEEDEQDARIYMWQALSESGLFSADDIRRAMEESTQ
jgi:hypothetical protein